MQQQTISQSKTLASTNSRRVVNRNNDRSGPAPRSRLLMLALKVNQKFHPDMFQANGNPKVNVGNFGSL